jgi:hypothetical protein
VCEHIPSIENDRDNLEIGRKVGESQIRNS